jgi:2-octaprenylphenol hydroxylase
MHTKNLGHIVENKVVLSALLSRATEQQLPIICNAKVTDLSEPVLGNGEAYRLLSCEIKDPTQRGQPPVTNTAPKTQIVRQFKATLIVGADGALSKIRQLSAIPLWQWDYGHHAIVATVETLESHQQTAWQRFTEDGPLAFLPLASDKLCSIVWSTSPAHAKALMAMSDRQFKQALSIGFEHRIGEVVGVANRAAYPLSHRHAKYYVKSGLALIGDAIHTIHPLAGQGVNLGLLDAAVLADTLANAKQRRQSIGSEALLKQYQRLRYSDNLKMSATMQAFKYLFDPQNAPLTIARNLGMNLFNKSRPLKQHIMLQAMGLSGKMPELAHKRIR